MKRSSLRSAIQSAMFMNERSCVPREMKLHFIEATVINLVRDRISSRGDEQY